MLDGEPITRGKAFARLAELVRKNADLQAVISADKKLPYEEVVAIIDLVKQTGVKTFALNIERKKVCAGRGGDHVVACEKTESAS